METDSIHSEQFLGVFRFKDGLYDKLKSEIEPRANPNKVGVETSITCLFMKNNQQLKKRNKMKLTKRDEQKPEPYFFGISPVVHLFCGASSELDVTIIGISCRI